MKPRCKLAVNEEKKCCHNAIERRVNAEAILGHWVNVRGSCRVIYIYYYFHIFNLGIELETQYYNCNRISGIDY